MSSLSVLIPARNEVWLNRTIQDVVSHIQGDTDIIAVLDGHWPAEPIPDHPRVHLVYHPEPRGQRQSTNEAARLSTAKYVMKLDAHCAVDDGFDVKLMQPYETGEIGMDTTTVPRLYNLHVFDWVCPDCGRHRYQGPKPVECGDRLANGDFRPGSGCGSTAEAGQEVVWQPRWNRITDFARFDAEPRFQYWRQYRDRPEAQGELADLMCHVGACWMLPRERYWDLGGMDEGHGSWGQMGIEVSCKAWLSGGRQIVNKRTWYAHLFRTQKGFGFPYPLKEKDAEAAREYSRRLWFDNAWPKQTRPLSWLIRKFQPVPEWPKQPEPTKGLVYYTDNQLEPDLFNAVQRHIDRGRNGHELVSVSLAPMTFGRNIHIPAERGTLTYFRQILAGLEASTADVVFLCEHDVLYHPSHFTFEPPRMDTVYYNTNAWRVDAQTGRAVTYDYVAVSQVCASRSLLLEHYRKMVAHVEAHGYDKFVGYEPGNTPFKRPGISDIPVRFWRSDVPNIDIRHPGTLTKSRWSTREFHDKRTCANWQEADGVPGWGQTRDRFRVWLQEQMR
jgi:hypothetical protein